MAREIHAVTHTGTVSSSSIPTFCDYLLVGLADKDYSIMPIAKDDHRLAFLVYARIEFWWVTFCSPGNPQFLMTNGWHKDTGNVMTNEQIIVLSERINKQELINYRNAVGYKKPNI